MSVNFPVGGIGASSGAELPAVEPTVKSKSIEDAGVNAASLVSPYITNTHELRVAEIQGEKVTVSDEQLVKAIENAIKAMQGRTTSLEFSVHQKTKLISVKVVDTNTGETIREIPPEKSLDFVAKLWEMAGIIIDERR
ncbi:flagellar protein FlaG [Paenibacillus roseipurpureus]|uniref:Flagellar protein FlaG n=1 Tax=Paenibacillus roseopurpureus TaxID=2918901 RepID=A0AA96LP32_9BACL|nr:flagellar protein FlaG [Paenibacillus sp. MBLB1832]WNR44697.1 flagellar protein FlaG [Paenibacillus sp. MBLB1832]